MRRRLVFAGTSPAKRALLAKKRRRGNSGFSLDVDFVENPRKKQSGRPLWGTQDRPHQLHNQRNLVQRYRISTLPKWTEIHRAIRTHRPGDVINLRLNYDKIVTAPKRLPPFVITGGEFSTGQVTD